MGSFQTVSSRGGTKYPLAWIANPIGCSLCPGVCLTGRGLRQHKNQRMLRMNQVGPRNEEEGGGCGREEQVHFQEQEGRGQRAKEGLVGLSLGDRD